MPQRLNEGDFRWRVSVVVLLALYGASGVFGRFPWKADEPYAFGVVWSMLERGQWLIPSIADQPFVEKPPLVYWLGACFAKLVTFAPPHEGSRGAILLLVTLTMASVYASAKMLHREVRGLRVVLGEPAVHEGVPLMQVIDARSYGLLALVVMAGTLGFAEYMHKLTPDLGQLAGETIALCGLVGIADINGHGRRRRMRTLASGLLLGTGTGVAFLSKGLFVPGVLVLTVLGCLFVPPYRRRSAIVAFAIAMAASAPWIIVWPLLFRYASPSLFGEWLIDNNVGRFLGHVTLGGNHVSLASRFASLVVMGFPAIVFAAITLTNGTIRPASRNLGRDAPGHFAIVIHLAVSLVTLAASASMRDVYLLPVLPALVLLAMPQMTVRPDRLGVHAARFVDLVFAALATILLVVWLCLVARGDLTLLPPLRSLAKSILPLPFDLRANPLALVGAAAALFAWRETSRHAPVRSAGIALCCGIAMAWILSASLFLPWIDAARSYRSLFLDLQTQLIAGDGCLVTVNLGESEVALLDYVTHAHIVRVFRGHSGVGDPTQPNADANRCRWMLILSNRSSGPIIPDDARWTPMWSGARPADGNERFVLYRARQTSR